jgi:hypothetical protein
MYKLSRRDIFYQLKADLIGKDSHRGITLTYGWLANQFGHFGIGYILTVIIYFSFKNHLTKAILTVPIIVMVMVVAFETYNFLGPLLKKSKNPKPFSPAWGNIAFDTITDVLFFGLGAFSTNFIASKGGQLGQYITVVIAILLLYPCYYWFKTKLIQQNACYPFQSRLSQWNHAISDKDKETINNYLQKNLAFESTSCLIIFGSEQKIKTELAVSIGNEYSIKHKICSYTTLIKLLSISKIKDPALRSSLWSWQDSSLLIVDDVSYDCLNEAEIITPDIVLDRANRQFKKYKFHLGVRNYIRLS